MSRRTPKTTRQTQPRTENVQGAWLLKATLVVVLAAAFCTYLTLCLLFYHGQWQIVLHPVQEKPLTTDQDHLIRFAPDSSAQPQLVGEWLPAAAGSRYGQITILFLPGGDGNRASFFGTQKALHDLGLNVFIFDYRGYGQSKQAHPSQQLMEEDSEAAWDYLTGIHKIAASSILPYGVGVGASLAVRLAEIHPEIPGVILDSPHADLREIVRHDTRWRLLPVGMLFHEDFPLAEPLSNLSKPKLLISGEREEPKAFQTAATPKITIALPSNKGELFDDAIRRFLDQYLVISTPALSGIKAP
ncbi:alpha/beta hydrolase [Edaphobacter albus]|uniref:alpha/beta hydrolase n=1 Tax=Edaphobacter sp. 4G125 TaxID=2763071 RepID=UPI001648F6E8|nr:alpha/beta fold hydrolase [Edaphobacter sp. 4G125]QNI35294.1 alpha/beta fold hydrolase [Edaphobacter sp. 4G125]